VCAYLWDLSGKVWERRRAGLGRSRQGRLGVQPGQNRRMRCDRVASSSDGVTDEGTRLMGNGADEGTRLMGNGGRP
jgi:hypothetical protein